MYKIKLEQYIFVLISFILVIGLLIVILITINHFDYQIKKILDNSVNTTISDVEKKIVGKWELVSYGSSSFQDVNISDKTILCFEKKGYYFEFTGQDDYLEGEWMITTNTKKQFLNIRIGDEFRTNYYQVVFDKDFLYLYSVTMVSEKSQDLFFKLKKIF